MIVQRHGQSSCDHHFSPSNWDNSNNEDDGKLFSDGGLRGDDAAARTAQQRRQRPIPTGDFRARVAEQGAGGGNKNDGKRTSYPPAQAVLLKVSISIVGEGMRGPKIDSTTNPRPLNWSVLATSASSKVGHGVVVSVDCIEERSGTEREANAVGIVKKQYNN